MTRNYIGLATSFHDSAIAIVDADGQIVFAEATERYLQHKRAINIAPDLLQRTRELIEQYCDPQAEIVLALSWSDRMEPLLKRSAERLDAIAGDLPPHLAYRLATVEYNTVSSLKSICDPGRALDYALVQLGRNGARPLRRHYDHHLAHAAAACFTSGLDNAACAILDGYGEGCSYACFRYDSGRLTRLTSVASDDAEAMHSSLGIFYAEICRACGFDPIAGDEWKVMGLAPYGELDEDLYATLHRAIRVDGLEMNTCGRAELSQIHLRLDKVRQRCAAERRPPAALARAGQAVFTDVLLQYLRNLHEVCGNANLVFAGGCALNSAANGVITKQTQFKRLYVSSAPGDDGNAVGAALLAYFEDHPQQRPPHGFQSAYLGSCMSSETLERVERFGGIEASRCHGSAPRRAAQLLSEGKIIGWIQGRAEFGPRALGNRSILADPRSPGTKDQLNSRVKFREEFRPFAPSILHDWGRQYFEDYQESPYMERTLRFRPEVRQRVPAVVHEDGTGRLQTVKREWNAPFYQLIEEFRSITGIPLVLNTSYNVMGKPIVHSVEDVLAVFFTSGLDAVFIDDVMLVK